MPFPTFGSRENLFETMPLWVFGHPFGIAISVFLIDEELGLQDQDDMNLPLNPAPLITSSLPILVTPPLMYFLESTLLEIVWTI